MSVMETLGGIGSLIGPIPGAIILGALPEVLRPLTAGAGVASLRLAAVGLFMVVLLIIRPQGLFGMSIKQIYVNLDPIFNIFKHKQNPEDIKKVGGD
jgi:ABC-type branched-subunit amino acid transport system permease subunit